MKKKKSKIFGKAYLIYVGVLAIVVVACIIHVARLLNLYEEMIPEAQVNRVIKELEADAASGEFMSKYQLAKVVPGAYEASIDVEKKYLDSFSSENVEFTTKGGMHAEDELFYLIQLDGTDLAEVMLKAAGPAKTRLTVLNFREWNVEYVKPLLAANDYTLNVPTTFSVKVNGTLVDPEMGIAGDSNDVTYTFSGLYFAPELEIYTADQEKVNYKFRGTQILGDFYNYSLKLPETLEVKLDGVTLEGNPDGEMVRYEICSIEKPDVKVADVFGNEVTYEAGKNFPLTYLHLVADSTSKVTVEGKDASATMTFSKENPEYATLVDYVDNLPQINNYEVAVLVDHAKIEVEDQGGNLVTVDPDEKMVDLTNAKGLDEVPLEVSEDIDVLKVAQSWSMFMTKDKSFGDIEKSLLKGSYQHKMAKRYSTSIDITFTSKHVLLDPAFTGNEVTNLRWITDQCFSVDISFVKHMRLGNGNLVDDAMSDRFFFVYYDDTDDHKDNPSWKLVSMKEIVGNEKK